jgi:polysaccharide deacetylase family protein (PEP-CTERM system associated)
MNVLTIDVEEYFHVSAFEQIISSHDWPTYESRVEKTTHRLLKRLSETGTLATFFVLGWVAERHPELIRTIRKNGHEVASHGYAHQVLTVLTPPQFRADVRRAKRILEDILGEPVVGYRAPSFTIMEDTVWALRTLVEEGYVYDSSIFPVWHDRYGLHGANPYCHRLMTAAGPIWEVPPSTLPVGNMRLPVAGGGYFRLWPYRLLRRWLRKIELSGHPLVVYLHPWEIDPEQPRVRAALLSRCRHYLNLHKTEGRLVQLLQDFRFGSIADTIEPIRQMAREQVA